MNIEFDNPLLTDLERKDIKGEALDRSRLFNKYFWPDYKLFPEIKELSEFLFANIIPTIPTRADRIDNSKRLVLEIAVLVIDLFKCHLEDDKQYLSFARSNDSFVVKRVSGTKKVQQKTRTQEQKGRCKKYTPIAIGRTICKTVDILESFGYIEQHLGFYNKSRKRNKGRITRIRATDKLITLMKYFSLSNDVVIQSYKPSENNVLIVKNKDKEPLEYEDNPILENLRERIIKFNDMLENHYFDINLTGDVVKEIIDSKRIKKRTFPVKINLLSKYYRRIFNQIDTNTYGGGRFFGNYIQNIPSALRKRIMIGDLVNPPVEVIEWDYKALHPVLLYLFEGIDYFKKYKDDDPYLIDGYDPLTRKLFKLVLLTVVNAEDSDKAFQAIQNEFNLNPDYEDFNHFNINKLMIDLENKHPDINHHFYGGAGIRLQNADANISSLITSTFSKQSLPIALIHDSYLARHFDSDTLVSAMINSFKYYLKGKGLMVVEPQLKKVSYCGTLEEDKNMMLRYNRWKTLDKTIQIKHLTINNK